MRVEVYVPGLSIVVSGFKETGDKLVVLNWNNLEHQDILRRLNVLELVAEVIMLPVTRVVLEI